MKEQEQEQQEPILLPFKYVTNMSFKELRSVMDANAGDGSDMNLKLYVHDYLTTLLESIKKGLALVHDLCNDTESSAKKIYDKRIECLSLVNQFAPTYCHSQVPLSLAYVNEMSKDRLVKCAIASLLPAEFIISSLLDYFCKDRLAESFTGIEDDLLHWRGEGRCYIQDALTLFYDKAQGDLWYNLKTRKLQQKCKP